MDDLERQAWIADLKRRHGLRCTGDEEEQAATPAWQDYVPTPSADVPYRFFSLGPLLASPDGGVHWHEKPEDMTTEEFLSSLR